MSFLTILSHSLGLCHSLNWLKDHSRGKILVGTVRVTVKTSRELRLRKGLKGWLNKWGGEILRWEIAALTKGINGRYCRGSYKLSWVLENQRVLYWKLICCWLTLKEKQLLKTQLFDDCTWTIKVSWHLHKQEYTMTMNETDWRGHVLWYVQYF